MHATLTMTSEVCGVIATIIPIYLLVLFVGDQRLMQTGRHVVVKVMITYLVAATTAAELLAVVGLIYDGLSGFAAGFVGGNLLGVLTGTSLLVILDIWLRES